MYLGKLNADNFKLSLQDDRMIRDHIIIYFENHKNKNVINDASP